MTGFGDQLREERERRGLSLDALCAVTKVQRRHLEALEHDQFHDLPGGVFRRGIVRAYLKATGLEEESWMPRFQQSYEEHARRLGQDPEPDSNDWATFAENVKRNRVPAAQSNSLRWLGVLVILLVLIAAAWAVWHFILRHRIML